jgi:hypothetical protein
VSVAKDPAKPRPRYRSTKTGRYVTKKYAKKHPKRTVKERRDAVGQTAGQI